MFSEKYKNKFSFTLVRGGGLAMVATETVRFTTKLCS
jgi:hypothetical protein